VLGITAAPVFSIIFLITCDAVGPFSLTGFYAAREIVRKKAAKRTIMVDKFFIII
jgi:hypothetical protein